MLNNYLGAMADIITAAPGHHRRVHRRRHPGDLRRARSARDDDAPRARAPARSRCSSAMEAGQRRATAGWACRTSRWASPSTPARWWSATSARRSAPSTAWWAAHVNLTGRIESYTVGGQVLISESTLEGAGAREVDGPLDARSRRRASRSRWRSTSLRGMGGEGGVRAAGLRRRPGGHSAREIPVAFTVLEGKHGTGVELAGSAWCASSMLGADVRADGASAAARRAPARAGLPRQRWSRAISSRRSGPDAAGSTSTSKRRLRRLPSAAPFKSALARLVVASRPECHGAAEAGETKGFSP